MIVKIGKTIDVTGVAGRFIVAGVLVVAVTLSVFPGSSFAASGDADDDGVGDSDDNCVYVSNADQFDDVSAFLLTAEGYNENGNFTYSPLWAPSDKSKTRIFVGDILKTSGTDFTWNTDGKVEFTTVPTTEVWLVALGDADGRGDKCSPNLGVDFDGIPDKADNCPLVYNPYQEDTWGTSTGDACESGSAPVEIYQVWAKMYEHANYTGVEELIRVNDVLLTGNAIGDNALSSIRVGPHTAVYVYTLPNYGGSSEFFGSDDADFMDNTVGHDTVSSIRMFSTAPIAVTKISTGIDFWSGTNGHVGLILTAELESLVASGAGSAVTLQHDFVDSVQSITVTYNGSGDYVVSTTNLNGFAGETAHFHYEGISETATATPTATVVAMATATVASAPTATPQPRTAGSYTVHSGDYLSKIAALYGTSVQVLALANDIDNTDLIFIGQTLTIP